MRMWARVRRLTHGANIDDVDTYSEGVPPSLSFLTPDANPATMRNNIDVLATVARGIITGRPPQYGTSTRWFDEVESHPTIDLSAIEYVWASKSPTLNLDGIGARVILADLMKKYRCHSSAQLLDLALHDAFRDQARGPTAIRFGGAGAIYLCNLDGSHRIAAVRAQYRSEGKKHPLALTLLSLEPGAALRELLAEWEIIVATIRADAMMAMLGTAWRRFDRFSVVTEWVGLIVAVIRCGSIAAKLSDAVVDQGRAFGLRQFLKAEGCRL